MNKEKTNRVLEYFNELFPDAYCELNHETDFQLLVAVMLSATGLIVVCAGYADIPTWLRIFLIIAAFLAIFSFTALVCVLGASSEIFECPRCGKKFSVSLAAYILGMHTTSKRKLKCPHCGKTSWCRSFWRK